MEAQLANFGTATGIWLEENRLLSISEFAEKPTVDYARSFFPVAGFTRLKAS